MEKIWSALFFFLAPSLGPSQPEVMGSGVLSLLPWLLWPTKSLAEHSLGTHAAADTALKGEASLASFALLLGCPQSLDVHSLPEKWDLQIQYVLFPVQSRDQRNSHFLLPVFQFGC